MTTTARNDMRAELARALMQANIAVGEATNAADTAKMKAEAATKALAALTLLVHKTVGDDSLWTEK